MVTTYRYSNKKSGFTLAEVVVGVLILGMAITLLGRAVSDALNAYQMSYLDDPFIYPMQEVRKEILKIGTRAEMEEGGEMEIPVIVEDRNDGTAETNILQVRWEAEVQASRILDLFVVELSLRFQSGGGTEIREARYMLYRPGWGESEEEDRLIEMKENEFRERLSGRGLDAVAEEI